MINANFTPGAGVGSGARDPEAGAEHGTAPQLVLWIQVH